MILSDGAEIKFNWHAISQKEWRAFHDKTVDEEAKDIIAGKLIGMTPDELTDLSPVDYHNIGVALYKSFNAATDTSSSKNLVGESTSD